METVFTPQASRSLDAHGRRSSTGAHAATGRGRRRVRRRSDRALNRVLRMLAGGLRTEKSPGAFSESLAPTKEARARARAVRRRGDQARARSAKAMLMKAQALLEAQEKPRFPGTDKLGLRQIPFAGRAGYVEAPPQVQATSHQLAGYYPGLAAGSRPVLGAPMGWHYKHRYGIYLDLMTMYLARGSSSASMFIFGLQGRGKSSFLLRMCLGMLASGFLLVFPGDLKGEYTKLVKFAGGEVIEVGPNKDAINPLDAGPLEAMIEKIADPVGREEMLAEMRTTRHLTVRSLVEMVLGTQLSTKTGERRILSEAIDRAVKAKSSKAVLGDIRAMLQEPDKELLRTARVETESEFEAIARPLIFALDELIESPEFGGTFARPTTRPMPLGVSVSFDISSVPVSQARYRAALQIVTWSYAQSVTSSIKTLQAAGLWPETHYVQVFDELWQALQVDPRVAVFMLEEIIRISRTRGIGSAMVTHGTGDLKLPDADLTARAMKFVARSSMRVYAGIDHDEIKTVEGVQKFTSVERSWLSEWAADAGYGGTPPGRGKFLIKFGDEDGIPLDMGPKTVFEHSLHNTDTAFDGARAAFAA